MICDLCSGAIRKGDVINFHHPLPKSQGGIETQPTHKDCHVEHHSNSGDFREWGRIGGQISALSKQWAFNLRNVRNCPAYDFARLFNRAHYAH
jgi:hypothetical protein